MTQKEIGQNTVLPANRDYHIDNIKGILIFLVVCGHLLTYPQETGSTLATGVRTFIYFFHMPGFIFMSGYLAKGFLKKEYKGEKLLSYAWLYLLFKNSIELVHFTFRRPYFADGGHTAVLIALVAGFCVAVWILSLLYERFSLFRKGFFLAVVGYSFLWGNPLTVGAAPWYLLALIQWYIILWLTQNIQPKYVLTTVVLFAACINYQESVGKFLTLSRAVNFFPFFLCGFYLSKEQFQKILSHRLWKKILPVGFLLAGICIIVHGRAVKKWLGVFFFGISPYSKLLKLGRWYYSMAPLTYILWAVVVLLLLFGLFMLCPRRKTFLAKFGKNTLSIYILHRLFKDFLIYGGFYPLLSQKEGIAVLEVLLVSLLLAVVFGTDFWAKTIQKLSIVHAKWLYKATPANSTQKIKESLEMEEST